MAGFAACREPNTYNAVLTHLSEALREPDLILFGTPSDSQRRDATAFTRSEFHPGVLCPETYTRAENADFDLFAHVEADTSLDVAYYVTDGVQSARNAATFTRTLQVMDRWFAAGNHVAIAVFTSRFEGNLWSQSQSRFVRIVNVENRPFYVFVLARSSRGLDEAMRILSTTGAGAEIFRWGGAPLRCTVRSDLQPRFTPPRDLPYRFVASSARASLVAGSHQVAELACSADPYYPVETFDISGEASRWAIQGGTATRVEGVGPPVAAEVSRHDSSTFSVVLSTHFPPARDARYNVYEVLVRMSPHGLPPRIRELNAASDAAVGTEEKTYRIENLFSRLNQLHWQHVSRPFRQYFTISEVS